MRSLHQISVFIAVILAICPVESVYHLNSTELFHVRLDPAMFWPEMAGLFDVEEMNSRHHYPVKSKTGENFPEIEYEASLKSMPDLPNWITQRHPKGSLHAYLYGAAPKPGVTKIDVVAFNRKNYKITNKTIILKTAEKPRKANFEVQLKFFDINVEDMLRNGYHTDLVKIFQRNLWNPQPGPEEDVYLTQLASAVDMGYRLPHDPKEKEGVIVHIGSVYPFSMKLQNIEKEVQPLLAHSPCPKDFRKTSAHHYFSRKKHFKIDWCGFRLFSRIDDSRLGSHVHANNLQPDPVPVFKDENDFFQPPAAKSHTRDLLLDFVLCIVIPAAVIIILLVGLTFIMFCNREGLDERNKLVTSVELSEFNSIQRASHKLREMAINREQPMLALPAPSSNSSMHGNSLPRPSPGNSPKINTPANRLQPNVRLGAGVRRPSSLRPPYSASSAATSRRNSTMTH